MGYKKTQEDNSTKSGKQNEKFNKDGKYKKGPKQILELKNTVNQMKNVMESINSQVDQSEDRNFEIIQSEENKRKRMGKKMKKAYVIYRTASNKPMLNHWSLEEEREKWTDNLFKEIMAENFLNLRFGPRSS